MNRATIFSGALACVVVACATGTVSTGEPVGDGGIVFAGDASKGSHDSGVEEQSPTQQKDSGTTTQPDTGTTKTCTGTLTLCDGTTCVDTSTDPNNCGTCDNACDTSSTCTSGQCVANQTSNAPPQGTCTHSLCTTGNYLDEGCDPAECTVVICDPNYLGDDYCCDTSWDSECIDEVNTYCAPYSCQ